MTGPGELPRAFTMGDWPRVRMVVFDLDGTLYEQRGVRLAMAAELALHALRQRSLRDLKAISRFRALREAYAERERTDFSSGCIAEAAAAAGLSGEQMAALVEQWLERRPLRHLLKARVAGAAQAFAALAASGRTVAVWSDYPVPEKLAALGLAADLRASAADPEVGRLKPHAAGLLWLCGKAGVPPAETLMIGDRVERDGEAAKRAGAFFLLRSRRAPDGPVASVADFRGPLFRPEAMACPVST